METATEQPLLNSHPISHPEAPPIAEESPGEPMEGVEMENKGPNSPTSPGIRLVSQPDLVHAATDAMDLDDHDQGLEIPDSQATQSLSGSPQNIEIENLVKELKQHANPEQLAQEEALHSSPIDEVMEEMIAKAHSSTHSSPQAKRHADKPEVFPLTDESVVEDANRGLRKSPELDGQSGKGKQVSPTVIDLDAEAKEAASIKEQTSGPVIFILDSLGSGPNQHNPTIQNLRRYLQNEASSKRTIQINDLTNAIQGGYADVCLCVPRLACR